MSSPRNASDIFVSPRGVKALLRRGITESVEVGSLEAAAEDREELAAKRAGLEAALVKLEEESEEREGVLFTADHGPTSLLQTFLAEQAAARQGDLLAQGKLVPVEGGGFEVKFDDRDIGGWVGSFFTWWRRLTDKHPFKAPPAAPDTRIPNHARIAVLGDWGTGRYGAPVCAATIQKATPRYDVLLHLGDVYYSGTPSEIQERFLDIWPKVPGAVSRAVNSNHEMYAGGHGFFENTLKKFEQKSSCFAMENDHFLLVGLDTGYDEHDLEEGQVPWLTRLVEGAEKNGQKVVLFTHHQPFSAFEKQGPKLVDKLLPLLTSKRILAWYWGHEHRAVLYEKKEAWGMYGRLIGHSGYPYFRDKVTEREIVKGNPDGTMWRKIPVSEKKKGVPECRVLDGPNPFVPGKEDRYGPQGYMTLELLGGTIAETVHAADGTVLHQGEIKA